MKGFQDLYLRCCHCKRGFQGASSLLVHFAEHALSGENITSLSVQESKDDIVKSCLTIPIDNEGPEGIDQKAKTTFTELNIEKELNVKKEDEKPHEESSVPKGEGETFKKAKRGQEGSEDFNPIKFCVITMGESDESAELKTLTHQHRLTPKSSENIAPSEQEIFRKKYVCHLCSKAFGWSTDLKRHIRIHTGERPFKCRKCEAAFTRNFLLQKHLSKVHPCKAIVDKIQKKVEDNLNQLKTSMAEIENNKGHKALCIDNKINRDNNSNILGTVSAPKVPNFCKLLSVPA